jgi:hypothetical protein
LFGNKSAGDLSFFDFLQERKSLLNNRNQVCVHILFFDEPLDSAGNRRNCVQIIEAYSRILEGKAVSLVNKSEVKSTRVKHGVEFFSCGISSSKEIIDRKSLSFGLSGDKFYCMSELSSGEKAVLEIR